MGGPLSSALGLELGLSVGKSNDKPAVAAVPGTVAVPGGVAEVEVAADPVPSSVIDAVLEVLVVNTQQASPSSGTKQAALHDILLASH